MDEAKERKAAGENRMYAELLKSGRSAVILKLGGGLHIDYSIGSGLFLTYWDRTASTTCIQDVLCADDLALAAETKREQQHMPQGSIGQSVHPVGHVP